jgi:GMP synthase-like glutamine amidotransferase
MLLIIQNGYITPFLSRYLDEDYQIVKSYEANLLEIDLDKYSIVVILGGNQSATKLEKYPALQNVVKLVKRCLDVKKPMLGICLGCQLVAYALGSEIKSCAKLNIGYDTSILGYNHIFRCHIDYIIPSANITVLEYFEEMPYFYQYENYVYGIQCHPDIAPECVKKYSNHAISNEYAAKYSNEINTNNTAIIKNVLNRLHNYIQIRLSKN